MKKIPLDMRHQFMAHNYEVVNFPSIARCDMGKALSVHCVDTSFPRLEMVIWLADMNLHTSHIKYSVCSYC